MLFNSLAFAVFLPLVYSVYWQINPQRVRTQNVVVVLASYTFYAWWDYRFLALIMVSSAVDYVVGLRIGATELVSHKRRWLTLSLLTNLGLLGFFKYFNFFMESFTALLTSVGLQANVPSLQIILPVGISFYTFQTLSYTIDVYRGRLRPTSDITAFFAFVAFFPQLVAGPIERAERFLPQFLSSRRFLLEEAKDGLRQVLWGFFKKLVIADNAARYVDVAFSQGAGLTGADLWLGALLFAFQIYGDFSGYSDIAIGTARLFGFRLTRNFAYPYFSRNIAEFWKRWHISLSGWFRDYLYIPLGGSRAGPVRHHLNILITFTVSGLWHGADWTFVVWGLINGLYFIPLMWARKTKVHTGSIAEARWFPKPKEAAAILLTFGATLIAWVFFRAESLGQAVGYLTGMFRGDLLALGPESIEGTYVLVAVALMVLIEWIQRDREHGLDVRHLPLAARWTCYLSAGLAIGIFGSFQQTDFIYFQF